MKMLKLWMVIAVVVVGTACSDASPTAPVKPSDPSEQLVGPAQTEVLLPALLDGLERVLPTLTVTAETVKLRGALQQLVNQLRAGNLQAARNAVTASRAALADYAKTPAGIADGAELSTIELLLDEAERTLLGQPSTRS